MSFNAKSSLPEDSEANRQNKSDGKNLAVYKVKKSPFLSDNFQFLHRITIQVL